MEIRFNDDNFTQYMVLDLISLRGLHLDFIAWIGDVFIKSTVVNNCRVRYGINLIFVCLKAHQQQHLGSAHTSIKLTIETSQHLHHPNDNYVMYTKQERGPQPFKGRISSKFMIAGK